MNSQLFVFFVCSITLLILHPQSQKEGQSQIVVSHFNKVVFSPLEAYPGFTAHLLKLSLQKSQNVSYVFESTPFILALITISSSHRHVVK